MSQSDMPHDVPPPPPPPETESPAPASASGGGGGNITLIMSQTKPWVRFMSVLYFISSGLMILFGVVAAIVGLVGGHPEIMVFTLLYLLFGVLLIFPSLYLFRYASQIGAYVGSGRSEHLEAALGSQKSFWKFTGVSTLVIMALYVLLFVAYIVYMLIATP